jgi:hypothetical protein
MLDLSAIQNLLPWLQVLMVPAFAYIVRIDRRLGQHEVLHTVNDREHGEMKARITLLENRK